MKSLNFTEKSKISPVTVQLNIRKREEHFGFFDESRFDGDVVGGGTVTPRGMWAKNQDEKQKDE